MQDLKTGDVIKFIGDDDKQIALREEVMGRVDKIVFTRSLLPNGAVGWLNPPQLIEDLITYGWKLEEREYDPTAFNNFLGGDPVESFEKLQNSIHPNPTN